MVLEYIAENRAPEARDPFSFIGDVVPVQNLSPERQLESEIARVAQIVIENALNPLTDYDDTPGHSGSKSAEAIRRLIDMVVEDSGFGFRRNVDNAMAAINRHLQTHGLRAEYHNNEGAIPRHSSVQIYGPGGRLLGDARGRIGERMGTP